MVEESEVKKVESERVTVAEYALAKGISKGQVYAGIKDGYIISKKAGKTWVFPKLTEEVMRNRALEESERRRKEREARHVSSPPKGLGRGTPTPTGSPMDQLLAQERASLRANKMKSRCV